VKVKRFFEPMRSHMQPGRWYESIPYDLEGTDKIILGHLEKWTEEVKPEIVSITGPIKVAIPACNGHCGGMAMELTVLYKDIP
jgi:hypothetical protein